jgi:hypothetical protein
VANRPVVFLGPSLDRESASRLLPGAEFRPPIRRGDLETLLADPPTAIGIVDGEFYQSLSVSPKEILPFLRSGVPVCGSSSMGALRAAELCGYGMTGIGTVFDWFQRGRLWADDEVAMTFCPSTLRPLSESLVNFRVALRAAQRSGLVTPKERVRISLAMKRLYFPLRTQRALASVTERILGQRSEDLQVWWQSEAPNAKADDARDLLLRIRELTSS